VPHDSRFPNLCVVDHPLVQVKLARLRDRATGCQTFRSKLAEIAALLLFEATRGLETAETLVQTPLEECSGKTFVRPLIIAPILRAGLGLVDGMLGLLDNVSVGHIGMFRDENTLLPQTYYFNFPAHLSESDVLVVDPMLATGASAVAAISRLKERGASRLRLVCVVSCPEGLEKMAGAHPDVPVFTAAVDRELNDRGYILPGLGDAGDRYFGTGADAGTREPPSRVESAKRG
jgi:uracil phosphoribosyltransferase